MTNRSDPHWDRFSEEHHDTHCADCGDETSNLSFCCRSVCQDCREVCDGCGEYIGCRSCMTKNEELDWVCSECL